MAECGVQTPRMKGPCAKWVGHLKYDEKHASRSPDNEDTPRLRQFAEIVNAGLDQGVQYTYLEIAEMMGHPNLRSVEQYGLGARYTRLRQKIYSERGVKKLSNAHRGMKSLLTRQQRIVAELRQRGRF